MDTQSLQVQAIITFIMPLLIQLAKRSQSAAFAWIDQNKPKICMLTSAVTALLTSMGIQIVLDAHSLTVRWPDSATLGRGFVTLLVSVVLQFAAQQMLYKGFWQHAVPSPSNQVATAKF
ncbi:MAG: hypothetical protein ABSG32_27180 [Terriglobia bacterium]|jgi:hypothetical protein